MMGHKILTSYSVVLLAHSFPTLALSHAISLVGPVRFFLCAALSPARILSSRSCAAQKNKQHQVRCARHFLSLEAVTAVHRSNARSGKEGLLPLLSMHGQRGERQTDGATTPAGLRNSSFFRSPFAGRRRSDGSRCGDATRCDAINGSYVRTTRLMMLTIQLSRATPQCLSSSTCIVDVDVRDGRANQFHRDASRVEVHPVRHRTCPPFVVHRRPCAPAVEHR